MYELKLTEHRGQIVADSRDVARAIGKERAPGSKRRAVDLLTADELTVYQKQENAVASLYAVGVDYEAMKAVLLTERTK